MREWGMMLALGAALLAPSASAADTAKAKKAAAAVPAPPAGMGQIVFYRSPRLGVLLSCGVSEEGEFVNKLPHGKYFVHPTTPGIHQYEINSDLLSVEVKDGETQYVRCSPRLGVPILSLQSRVDFDRHVRALRLLPPWTGE
jgi:hypothetical protein